MPSYSSQPYTASVPLATVVSPGASVGNGIVDTVTFYNTSQQLANKMVANQYYTVTAVGGVNFGSYGTLQAVPFGNGVANTVGAVYLATGPATLIAGSTGASASFANNAAGIGVMTLTVAATGGTSYPIVGQVVSGTGLPLGGLIVVSILSGANNAVSSTYLLSGATGTVGAAAVTLSQAAYVDPYPIAQAAAVIPYTPNPVMVNPNTTPLASTVYSALTSTTPFGFATLAQAQSLVAQVNAINAALLAIGILG